MTPGPLDVRRSPAGRPGSSVSRSASVCRGPPGPLVSGPGPTRRTVTLIVAAAVVAITCVALGIWQLARLQEKRELNATVRAGLSADPIEVGGTLTDAGTGAELSYRRATATGRYDPEREVVLYGRTLDETGREPSPHATRALRRQRDHRRSRMGAARSGNAAGCGRRAARGHRRRLRRVFPSEGDGPGRRRPGRGHGSPRSRAQISRLSRRSSPTASLPSICCEPIRPRARRRLPRPAALPELTEGPHLSYAIQWFLFAAIALIGCAIVVRRDRDERAHASVDGGSSGGVGAE